MKAHRHSEAPAHKLVPTLLTGSLVLGTAAAVGHHFYNSFLDGQIVESQSQQEWYIRIGTGLAYLSRTLLSASVGFTYTQLLWRTLRSRPITVDGVDALFSLVGNIWNFHVWEIWRVGPVLIIVAMVTWALPLVAVVTPATLTVQLSAQPNETTINLAIPNLAYDSVSKFAYWEAQDHTLQGPSSRISRLLTAVTSYGSILPISNPQGYSNSSYILDFYGPAISCVDPGNSTFSEQISNLTAAADQGGSALSFAAFVPTESGTFTGSAIQGLNETLQGKTSPSTLDNSEESDYARLYVVTPPWPVPDSSRSSSSAWALVANTTIECRLYNTSYTTNFTFTNGEQTVEWNKTLLNGVNILSASSYAGAINSTQGAAYLSMLMALGNLLVGQVINSHYGIITTTDTRILSTVLTEVRELQILQVATDTSDPLTIANMSMADALEEVFTNATLSLFSDSYFLQNQTTASQSLTPVTIRGPQNEYHYEPRNIYIAYGCAIFVTAVLAAAGLLAIHAASASYGTSFSTIVRTTRNPDLDALIPAAASTGAEPTPRPLAGARVILRQRHGQSQSQSRQSGDQVHVPALSSDGGGGGGGGGGEAALVSGPPARGRQAWTCFEVVQVSGPGTGGRGEKSGSYLGDEGTRNSSPTVVRTRFPGKGARRASFDSLLQESENSLVGIQLPPRGSEGRFREGSA